MHERNYMKRVVITGATGMLGRALAEQLVANGIEVLLLINPQSKRASTLPELSNATIAHCSLDELKLFQPPDERKWDVFYHLAWDGTTGSRRDDEALQHANVQFALDAIECAARLGCHCFVGAGSQAEYGRCETALRPDTPTNPETAYGAAKLKAGILTRQRTAQLGMHHVWMRILSVYGPDDTPQAMVPSVITSLLAGNAPKMTSCEQIWDYIYRDDAAQALMRAGQYGKDGAIYPLGGADARPLREYVEMIRAAIDPASKIDYGAIPYAPNQIMHLEADISALTQDTGFLPRISFQEGIRRTIEHQSQKPV